MREFANIIDFTEAEDGLNIKLFPVQKFLLKLVHGIKLDERTPSIPIEGTLFTEAGYLVLLQQEGRCGEVEPDSRQVVLRIGRRGGSSLLISISVAYAAWQLLKLPNPQNYFGMPQEQSLRILVVSNMQRQAALLQKLTFELMDKSGLFTELLRKRGQDYIELATEPTIRIQFASQHSRCFQGFENYLVCLDDAASFTDLRTIYQDCLLGGLKFSHKDPDTGLPTGFPESKLIMISTPSPIEGFFDSTFDLPLEAGRQYRIISAQIPSWEINPTLRLANLQECQSPELYKLEFGAMPLKYQRTETILDALAKCLQKQRISLAKRTSILQEMRAALRASQ